MREFFHTMKVSFLLAAILYVILGLVLLLWPGVSAVVFCYAFGGVLLAYGVVTVVSFFLREFFHTMKVSFLLAAILYVILGLVLLLWPGVSAVVFCYAFGGVLLAYGVVTVVSFFLRDSRQGSFVFELLLGIIAAALGLLFLLRPAIVATILPVILGLFIVVDGLVNLKRALELRRMAYVRWNIPLWLSVGSVTLGAFIVFQPFLAAEALVMFLGAVLIYEGVSDLWTIFRVTQWTKEYRKTHPVDVDPLDF